MAFHNQFGKEAEQLAAEYFAAKGYEILFRNWRHSYFEIDIIATKNVILHFIEVKARRSLKFGYPEENVTKKKIFRLTKAVEGFLFQYPQYKNVQYDVLSITMEKDKAPDFFLIEDVYIW